MTTGVEQGRRLEERIGAFFEANGYRVSRNVVLEGRSGGRHEIDVLAEKSDALTTYKVAVECKAWQTPIEKDVVAKLYHVVDDLGLSKGIVVSLAGSRSGAQVAARERGIELWGTDELRHHLGEVPTAQLASARAAAGRTTAWGRPVRISLEAARTALESSGKGALNLRTVERLVWMSPVWLPAFSVRISVTQPEARLLKNRLRSVSVVRVYDALSGTYLGPAPATGWEQVEVEARTALPPALHAAKVLATLRKTVDDYTRVSTQAAVERHAARLAALGIPTPCRSISTDDTGLVYQPYYAGVLQRAGAERVVAVKAWDGTVAPAASGVLTAKVGHLRAHFGG